MSHFMPIKLPIKDGKILRQVLQEMRYKFHECDAEVSCFFEGAELFIQARDGGLWFCRDNETYKILSRATFPQTVINDIVQRYVQKALIATSQQQSFAIKEKETHPDSTVQVVVNLENLPD